MNGWQFSVDGTATTVEFTHHTLADADLVVPGAKLLALRTVTHDNVVEYLLAGSIDTAERLTLYRYHDTTGDGMPDASTQELLLSSTEAMYMTALSLTDGTAYLLDRRCQDILVATDTDADDWPDQLEATPYARADDHPSLLQTRAIRITSAGDLLAMIKTDMDRDRLPHEIFSDTDGDLVADAMRLGPVGDDPILMAESLSGSQNQVVLGGEAGKVAEVWELDGSGDTVVRLGFATIASNGRATIALSRALVVGEDIGMKYAVGDIEIARTVVGEIPQVLSTDPRTVPTGHSSTVRLAGKDFKVTTTFELREADGTVHTLTATYIDSSTVDVAVPSLTSEGIAVVVAYDAAEDQDVVGIRGMSLRVCDPEEE